MSSEKTVDQKQDESVVPKRKSAPILDRLVASISSVKFGVGLLCVLVLLSILGMIIVQQNVGGFDAYYAGLTPAEKTVWAALGFFDIYHSWYYNGLLLVLSLNLVLASIDRFPSAWSYIVKPKLKGSRGWLKARNQSVTLRFKGNSREETVEKVQAAFKRKGMRPVLSSDDNESYIFGEKGKWNRLGAYIVHVALLTLFLGHFVALQTGFDADVRFQPGQTRSDIEMIEFNLDEQSRYDVVLPFSITCLDIQQKLIDPNGSIEVFNTLDWLTKIRIDDKDYGPIEVDVSLNKPFHYRGYRFFQAQTVPIGNARVITLALTPDQGEGEPFEVKIPRNGQTTLDDGTVIKYSDFLADFTFNSDGQPDTRSGDYNNPAAVLNVSPKGSEPVRVFAFAGELMKDLPVGAAKAGYKWKLKEYEKSPFAHILSIKYDPYNGAFISWYIGGIGLIFALIFVFFFSHRRTWALVTESADGSYSEVLLAGEANRNQDGYEDRFAKLAKELGGETVENGSEEV
jgi:cytochrome c biogenesis protein